jgi:hypothetical protein
VEDILQHGRVGVRNFSEAVVSKVNEGKDFPTDWKIAIVCPIYKGKGDTRTC